MIDSVHRLYQDIVGGRIEDLDGSQIPSEFRMCLDLLYGRISRIEAEEIAFLEIGAFKGLWPLAFSVLCARLGKQPTYSTVTLMADNIENQSLLKVEEYYHTCGWTFVLIDGDSQDAATKQSLVKRSGAVFDFVLIDADHSCQAVRKDIQSYGAMASHLLLFHDINTPTCGVSKAIRKEKIELHCKIAHSNIMGIGIHDKSMPSSGSVPTLPPSAHWRYFRPRKR
jgi:hypothetical protein